jgi:hypothetical protein
MGWSCLHTYSEVGWPYTPLMFDPWAGDKASNIWMYLWLCFSELLLHSRNSRTCVHLWGAEALHMELGDRPACYETLPNMHRSSTSHFMRVHFKSCHTSEVGVQLHSRFLVGPCLHSGQVLLDTTLLPPTSNLRLASSIIRPKKPNSLTF